jgi:hypothetical protein
MIHPTRRELLRLLERASELDPDVRFGQLVAFLPVLVDGPTEPSLADLEDEPLLEALRRHVEALSRRRESVASVAAGRSCSTTKLSAEPRAGSA